MLLDSQEFSVGYLTEKRDLHTSPDQNYNSDLFGAGKYKNGLVCSPATRFLGILGRDIHTFLDQNYNSDLFGADKYKNGPVWSPGEATGHNRVVSKVIQFSALLGWGWGGECGALAYFLRPKLLQKVAFPREFRLLIYAGGEPFNICQILTIYTYARRSGTKIFAFLLTQNCGVCGKRRLPVLNIKLFVVTA